MKKITEKDWLEDFKDFVSSEGAPVPEELSQSIFKRIHKALNPSAGLVFSKLLGIHALVGTLSLAICDQFGMSPFNTGFSLTTYFMKFGHSICMALCGVLFISLTIALGYFILNGDEFRVLSKNASLHIFSLSVLSLAAFIGFGAQIVLGIGILWLLGALVGGLATTKSLMFLSRTNSLA